MCLTCRVNIDQKKQDKFAEKLINALNQGALTLMVSVGHRTGLFDVMAELEPSSSAEIAQAAKLNERYVREWLGAMVTGGVVDYDLKSKTYHLPAEHAAWLTRKNSPNNIAVTNQWMAVMASVEDRIVESFHKGGGLAYKEYHRFNEVMADESHQTVVIPLKDKLLPLVAGLKEKLEEGIDVLDVGCGSGRALISLAQAFPKSRFTGYDFLPSAIDAAEKTASKAGLNNIVFLVRNAADFVDYNEFDVVFTFDAVHDQANPKAMLRNIYNALKPGGLYFCQDIAGSSVLENNMTHPLAPFAYTISTFHCMSVSLAQNGAGLGTMWGKELACTMFTHAGFKNIEVKQLDHDIINYYYTMTK